MVIHMQLYLIYKINQNNLYTIYCTCAVNFKASYMHLIILGFVNFKADKAKIFLRKHISEKYFIKKNSSVLNTYSFETHPTFSPFLIFLHSVNIYGNNFTSGKIHLSCMQKSVFV